MITWGEFKKRVEDEGIKDHYQIRYIDITGFDTPGVHINYTNKLEVVDFTVS
jgi:hypothetical protein